jgi:hypothetical protein
MTVGVGGRDSTRRRNAHPYGHFEPGFRFTDMGFYDTIILTITNYGGLKMNDYEKLEWLVFAIQEAINGNNGELENALEIVEILREPYLVNLTSKGRRST